ncbi:MAG: YihY/virulence factor BrkB family protein, partial [Oscillibacter sp.]|nr:YihY/virulence factor BrkB family protein [Oscillibacter sp.]
MLVRFWTRLFHRYVQHSVGIEAAALAFFLLFMIFPLLIFISALLGLLQLNAAAITSSLRELLPSELVNLIGMYLNYVASNPSEELLIFGLVFSIYFPMRAANSLMQAVRTAYRLGPPTSLLRHWARVLIYTVLLIVAIALTLVLMTVGDRLLRH